MNKVVDDQPIKALAVDGGGMRGLYAASVLEALEKRFARVLGETGLDIAKGFDLVAGTSTGSILAAGLAAGLSVSQIKSLYIQYGPEIFMNPIPGPASNASFFRKVTWFWRHRNRAGNSSTRLRYALEETFGSETLGGLFLRRQIGLCIPTTGLLNHSPRVFKTPHLESRDRDDGLKLSDICLASCAAPIYLPVVELNGTGQFEGLHADGGLWANSPVMVALLEALALSQPEQPIVILSIGTCAPTNGDAPTNKLDQGVLDWVQGGRLINVTMNTQAQASQNMAGLLQRELDRLGKKVTVIRAHQSVPSSEQCPFLGLDSASGAAMTLMQSLGESDGHTTYGWCQPPQDPRGDVLGAIFQRMPSLPAQANGGRTE